MSGRSGKLCTACGTVKLYSEFHPDSTRADGVRYNCKACQRAAALAYWRRRGYMLQKQRRARARLAAEGIP